MATATTTVTIKVTIIVVATAMGTTIIATAAAAAVREDAIARQWERRRRPWRLQEGRRWRLATLREDSEHRAPI
eukprot:11220387-Lingulodinium_polyedra.AAC.1